MAPSPAALGRVEALLRAARQVFAEPSPELVAALAAESGLSTENVRRALLRHLELAPSDNDLSEFCARAPKRSCVLVILAANVFVAPLRALAWAFAQASEVRVRSSRHARVFVRALLAATVDLAVTFIDDDDAPERVVHEAIARLPAAAAVHVYGNADTVAQVAATCEAHALAFEGHGPGVGALIASAAAVVEHALAVASDVVAFDQRGCLSPRLLLVLGDAHDGALAAKAMHQALEELGERVPRGALSMEEQAAHRAAMGTAQLLGTAWVGMHHLVMDLGMARGTPFGPTGRVLPVVAVPSLEEAIGRLAAVAELSAVGVEVALLEACRCALPAARVSALGCMQSPPLDGPVDRRVLHR